MRILKIFSLDDPEESTVISTLSEGEHFIGRDKLNCKDKRISRNHALIIIAENNVTLKSTHINPSFYKPNGGNSIKLIKKDEYVTINDGDHFALLADAFWFRTRVIEDDLEIETTSSSKRTHTNDVPNGSNKKAKIDEVDKDTSPKSIIDENVTEYNKSLRENESIPEGCKTKESASDSEGSIDFSNSLLHGSGDQQKGDQKLPENVKETEVRNDNSAKYLNESNNEEGENKNEETKENAEKEDNTLDNASNQNEVINENEDKEEDTTSNKNDPSTSTKTKRDRCWYGPTCYRRNPAHKQDFSHPGDSDYDDGDLPDCPFGSTCYRTNVSHRKQYKHTDPPAPKPVPVPNAGNNTTQDVSSGDEDSDDQTSTGRKKRKAAAKVTKYAETPEDDYDLQDPFINDASSDDFQLSGDEESDSDWQDSQEVDEESQERKRLLKEAKKFTRKKNKK